MQTQSGREPKGRGQRSEHDESGAGQPTGLHVLGGLHDGAFATLGQGASLIGSAAHCDLVLGDAGLEPDHLLLVNARNQITARALGSSVFVDGTPLKVGDSSIINPGALIVVAGLRLGIGAADQSWPAAGVADDPSSQQDDAAPIAEALPTSRAALVTFAVVAALAAGLVTHLVLRTDAPVVAAQTDEERFAQLREDVSALDEPELMLTRAADGSAAITGYVSNLASMQRLRRLAVAAGARVSVFAADELVRYANELLQSRQLVATVSYAGRGLLHLDGQDDAAGSLKAVSAQIQQELPGLRGIDSSIRPYSIAAVPPAVPGKVDPYVLSGINGVNSGHKVPYISSGDNYIFTGGVLGNGMSVISIERSRVLVDDRGNQRTSEVLVQ